MRIGQRIGLLEDVHLIFAAFLQGYVHIKSDMQAWIMASGLIGLTAKLWQMPFLFALGDCW